MMAPVLLTKKSKNVVERKRLLFAIGTGEWIPKGVDTTKLEVINICL